MHLAESTQACSYMQFFTYGILRFLGQRFSLNTYLVLEALLCVVMVDTIYMASCPPETDHHPVHTSKKGGEHSISSMDSYPIHCPLELVLYNMRQGLSGTLKSERHGLTRTLKTVFAGGCCGRLVIEEVTTRDEQGAPCANGMRATAAGFPQADGPPTTFSPMGTDRVAFAQVGCAPCTILRVSSSFAVDVWSAGTWQTNNMDVQ